MQKRLPPARFGRYEAETFRVYAKDLLLQRLSGGVFPKKSHRVEILASNGKNSCNLEKWKITKNEIPPARFGRYEAEFFNF